MPNMPQQEIDDMRKWVLAALKAGADSPRRVLEWIAQNSEKRSPSIPTISKIMREEGYEPVGYVWEKTKGK
jgi:NADH:ubiquinone oxidoreductase subunit E